MDRNTYLNNNSSKQDYTILIFSCDAFSDMWENINNLYDKYWVDHPDLKIVTDSDISKPDYKNVISYNESEMSTRLIRSVSDVKTKYVFLSFDDYYPRKQVNTNAISLLIKEMEQNDFDYCRIFNKPKVKGEKIGNLKYQILPLEAVYEVNFYPCIWKVKSLKRVLKENETIWKLEARITRRSRENDLKCIAIKQKNIFDFVDIVRKGKYLRSAYRFLKKNGLYISKREKRTIKETVALNTRIFLSEHLPKRIKNSLKARMRKKGHTYHSDYENTDD